MYETDLFVYEDKQTKQCCNKKILFLYVFFAMIVVIAIIFAIINLFYIKSTNRFIITNASNITTNSALIHIKANINQTELVDLCYIEKYNMDIKSFIYNASTNPNFDIQLDELIPNKTYFIYLIDGNGVASNFFWMTTLI